MRSKRRERYSRNLEGLNAHGFYSNSAVAPSYTAQAEIGAFIVNSVEGEIGVYTEDGGTLLTTEPAATDVIYIVQKQDGEVKRTQPFLYGDVTKVVKTPFDAPVIQEVYVGYNPIAAAGSLNINIVGGLQEFVASARETTPANQPFPIQEGRSIVRSGTPTDYEIASRIVEDLHNDGDIENNADLDFVRATVVSDLTGGTAATGPTNVTITEGLNTILGDAAFTSPVAGEFITYDGGLYKVVDVTGNYLLLDRPVSAPSATVVVGSLLVYDQAAVDGAQIGIRFRGYDELAVFEVSVSEDLADADISVQIPWKQGSGASWQVASMEDETSVFDGWTTNNVAWVEDYGKPSFFVDDQSTDQYDLTFITLTPSIIPSAGTPQNQTKLVTNIIFGAEDGTTGDGLLTAALDAIFPAT